MDTKGFETINAALAAADVEATVTPQPTEGQNARFVTIETDDTVQPQRVLNALAASRLVSYDGPQDIPYSSSPSLRPIGVQPGSLTFDDKNAGSGAVWR